MAVKIFQALSYDPDHHMGEEIRQLAEDWKKANFHLHPFTIVFRDEMRIVEFGSRLGYIFFSEIQITT